MGWIGVSRNGRKHTSLSVLCSLPRKTKVLVKLSRKNKSWEHGVRLGFPFPPACRGKGNHGNMGMRLRFLFPLPVEETAIMGLWHALAIPFSPCLSRKRQSWGGCDSLFPLPVEEKGSIGPSRARQRPRMTPPEHAKSPDCLFPLPVGEKAHSDFKTSPKTPPLGVPSTS